MRHQHVHIKTFTRTPGSCCAERIDSLKWFDPEEPTLTDRDSLVVFLTGGNQTSTASLGYNVNTSFGFEVKLRREHRAVECVCGQLINAETQREVSVCNVTASWWCWTWWCWDWDLMVVWTPTCCLWFITAREKLKHELRISCRNMNAGVTCRSSV